MNTPNFTTRIPAGELERFRQAALHWAQRTRPDIDSGRALTAWMRVVLSREAERELSGERPKTTQPRRVGVERRTKK